MKSVLLLLFLSILASCSGPEPTKSEPQKTAAEIRYEQDSIKTRQAFDSVMVELNGKIDSTNQERNEHLLKAAAIADSL